MAESIAIGLGTYGTGLGFSTSSVFPVVTGSSSFCIVTSFSLTSSGNGAVGSVKIVTKCLALGERTYGTSLGSSTGCIYPSVACGFTLGVITALSLTSSGSVAICNCQIVTKRLAALLITYRAVLSFGTSCFYPCMSKLVTFGLVTYLTCLRCSTGSSFPIVISKLTLCSLTSGTGLKGFTSSSSPIVTESFTFSSTAAFNRTGLGRGTGSFGPFVLMLRLA
jgi:hypothetical protein